LLDWHLASSEIAYRQCPSSVIGGVSVYCMGNQMDILKGFFSFSGRMDIAEYGTVILCDIVFLILCILIARTHLPLSDIFAILSFIAVKWSLLAALAKRFRDIEWSGLSCLLVFIPLIGLVIYIIMFFNEGTDGPNMYGPPQRFIFKNRASAQ
jgi:uncharacterized membrane protein YhaH (DUF805 family)